MGPVVLVGTLMPFGGYEAPRIGGADGASVFPCRTYELPPWRPRQPPGRGRALLAALPSTPRSDPTGLSGRTWLRVSVLATQTLKVRAGVRTIWLAPCLGSRGGLGQARPGRRGVPPLALGRGAGWGGNSAGRRG